MKVCSLIIPPPAIRVVELTGRPVIMHAVFHTPSVAWFARRIVVQKELALAHARSLPVHVPVNSFLFTVRYPDPDVLSGCLDHVSDRPVILVLKSLKLANKSLFLHDFQLLRENSVM